MNETRIEMLLRAAPTDEPPYLALPLPAVATAPVAGTTRRTAPNLAAATSILALALVAVGLLLSATRPVPAPIVGADPRSSFAPATPTARPSGIPVDAASLIGHTYLAIHAIVDGDPFASVAEARLELRFDGPSQFFAGAGCNGMGGEYKVDNTRLVLSNAVAPQRACVGPGMRDGAWYYAFLQSAPTISRDATGLVLSNGAVVVTYRDALAGAGPTPSTPTVSETVEERERRLLPTYDLLSEQPGFQVGGLTPEGDEVLVYWKGELGPEAEAIVEDANRRGIVVNVVRVSYSYDDVRKIAARLGEAIAAKGIKLEGWSIDFDSIVVWGSDLDGSAEARRLAEEIAAEVLPADLRFAIVTSRGPAILMPAIVSSPSSRP